MLDASCCAQDVELSDKELRKERDLKREVQDYRKREDLIQVEVGNFFIFQLQYFQNSLKMLLKFTKKKTHAVF